MTKKFAIEWFKTFLIISGSVVFIAGGMTVGVLYFIKGVYLPFIIFFGILLLGVAVYGSYLIVKSRERFFKQ